MQMALSCSKACVLCPEPPPLSWNTYLQKEGLEGKKREHMQAAGLELCRFCSEAEARLLFNAHTVPGCRKQETAKPEAGAHSPGAIPLNGSPSQTRNKGPPQAPRLPLT